MKRFAADTKIVAACADGGVEDVNRAAKTGRWVSLEQWDSATFVVGLPEVASQGLTVSVMQARDAAGSGAKAVTGLTFLRSTAPSGDTDSVGDDVAAATGDDSGAGTAGRATVVSVEVTADQLDVSGGFSRVAVRTARAANTAATGAAFVVLRGARFAVDPPRAETVLG